MRKRKAFINLKGKVDTKEMPAIEYIDENYFKRLKHQRSKIKELLDKVAKKHKKGGSTS